MPSGHVPARERFCWACGEPFAYPRGEMPDEQLAVIAALMAERSPEQEYGRVALRKAVAGLARARGLEATRAALRRLAVEALAWERRLPARVHDIVGVDAPRRGEAA